MDTFGSQVLHLRKSGTLQIKFKDACIPTYAAPSTPPVLLIARGVRSTQYQDILQFT